MHLHAVCACGEGGGEGSSGHGASWQSIVHRWLGPTSDDSSKPVPSALAPRYKPVGLDPPPQAQHMSLEVKSSSLQQSQLPWLDTYHEQSSSEVSVAPKSWSVHCPPICWPGGADGGLNPPPQAQHISLEVKSPSS